MPDTSIKDFEAAIAELETIVKKLEEGDLPLEQSLALYERGVQLSRFCHARLEEAERRIEKDGVGVRIAYAGDQILVNRRHRRTRLARTKKGDQPGSIALSLWHDLDAT